MKLHIWTDMLSYLAVAHADSVSDARRLLLEESDLGESGDGSCPERDKARCAILDEQPALYVSRVAEFTLSDSAQLREMEGYAETLCQQVAAKGRRIAELEAENARLRAALEPFARWANQMDSPPNWVPDGCPIIASPGDISDFCVGMLRRARAALAGEESEG